MAGSGRWIVRLTPEAVQRAGSVAGTIPLLNQGGVSFRVVRGLGLPGQILVQAVDASPAAVEKALGQNPNVAYFGFDALIIGPQAVPNDPRFQHLYGLENTGQTGGTSDADIDAPEAWEITTGSRDIVVAIIDSGVDYTHPDLAANIWTNPGEIPNNGIDDDQNGFVDDVHGYDFRNNDGDPMDDRGHGTHVAGTIAAVGNNGIGVTGINWTSSVMPLKFLDDRNQGATSDAIAAINYAVEMRKKYGVNVRVINASWGSKLDNPGLRDAIEKAGWEDILFVTAAGNGNILGRGQNNDLQPFYPASYDLDNVIAVAASDFNDRLTVFSNYGRQSVDLAAPGLGIVSTVPGGYGSRNGTSMAAPHVTGVAALFLSHVPYATALEVKEAILSGVDPVPGLRRKVATGGRLNALGTLLADPVAPRVQLDRADDITRAGGTVQEIQVTYTDNKAVSVASVDANDIYVVRSGDMAGDPIGAALIAVNNQNDGPTRTAVYRIAAPGGVWDPADNGIYEIYLRPDEVLDVNGNAAWGRLLGRFRVDVPNIGQIVVNSFDDRTDANPGDGVSDDGTGHSTLRSAIQEANAQPGENTIALSAGTYTLTLSGRGEDAAATGDLDVTDTLTIVGAGAGQTVIDANGLDRVFHVLPGASLRLVDVTVRGGRTTGEDDGAGVYNAGQLTISDSELRSNRTEGSGQGGGVYNEGVLVIERSLLAENQSANDGGGLLSATGGTANIVNSTFSGNTAAAAGGGIRNAGDLTLLNVTVALNTATGTGGGVANTGSVSLKNTLIARNTATSGDPDVSGAFTSQGNNLIGVRGSATGLADGVIGDLVGSAQTPRDPQIGPLQDNGGPTPTHALLPGSPALNAGSNVGAPATDQRNVARPQDPSDGTVDIGAFERYFVEIRGRKFVDKNGNGVQDDGEPGLAGWTIFLDLNQNGSLDAGEPSTKTSEDDPDTSDLDEAGLYAFTGLEPGAYTVVEVQQADFVQTQPRSLQLSDWGTVSVGTGPT
ncbi:MAG: S8 family serine peptidase, partial [Planctomycetes bacterium]|nr:S8 family serine peptidase [Planctomycetota bacterium]